MNEIEDFIEDPNENSDLFDCEFTSVDAVVNQIMVFTGWQNRATENGDRTLVAYWEGYNRSAFFTDSKKLKEVFCNPKRHYPFRAVIKVVSYGNMYGFRVFSPKSEITKEYRENFEFYKRTKNRRSR